MEHEMVPADDAARLAREQNLAGYSVGGFRLGGYESALDHRAHSHSLDHLVGYVVRETIDGNRVLWREQVGGPCGYDVALIPASNRYAEAVSVAHAYRAEGRYAVVDNLYACGCRS